MSDWQGGRSMSADLIQHEANDDCVCGPTPEPVKREDGSMGWFYIHHSLDGREMRERGQD